MIFWPLVFGGFLGFLVIGNEGLVNSVVSLWWRMVFFASHFVMFCVLFSNVLRLWLGMGGALGIFRELDRQIGLVKYSEQC